MNKIYLFAWLTCFISACSDADQARVPSVNVTGDGITFKVPVNNGKYNIDVTSSNSIIEIQRDQIVGTLTVAGTSSIISIRTGSEVDNIIFTGSENKVLSELLFDGESQPRTIPVTGEVNGNEVEYCKKDTAPSANGGCLPK